MTEIQRATPIEDEAKKTEYNADVFKNEDKRKESAGEIKKQGKYDKETEEGRKKLSDHWINRAGLTPNMKETIYKRIGITDEMDAKTRDAKVKEYQTEKKIKSDGIIGPQMLENLENEIGDNIAQSDSNAGDVGDFNPYADDAFQEADKRMTIEETKAQETEKEEKMSKFYTEHGDTDFDVALLEEAGIDEVEYNIYKAEKQKANGAEQKEEPKPEDKQKQLRELSDGLNGYLEGKEAVFGEYDLVSKKFEDGTMGYEDVESGQRLNLQTGELETEGENDKPDSQKALAKDTKETAYGAFRGVGLGKKLEDVKMSDIRIQLVETSEKGKISEIMKNAGDTKELKGITYGQYVDMLENSEKAAQKFASTDKPEKLPGGLGEDGVKYQRNEATKTVFAYRGNSEVPKILTADNKEVDIRDDIKNRGTLSEVDLGNNKTIVGTETQGKWTYELKEKKSDGTIATRKIKEDGRLENPTEGTLASVTEDR